MDSEVQTPKPGIYKDVPFAEYLAWDAISNSRISMAIRSLMHFRDGAFKGPSPTLRLGTFIHCGALEPLSIAMRYAVMPPYEKDPRNVTKGGERSTSKATTFYRQMEEQFRQANAGKELVEQSDYDTLIGISKSLAKSQRAAEFLSERGDSEVSILWIDDETQLPCKARIDHLNSGINDLKTCADALKFPKSIATYGYHRQGAHYQEGLAVLTGEEKPFRLIAVETTPPYGVRAAALNEDAIETGRSEVRKALLAIARAKDTGDWPGYEDPSSWCLPSYYGGGDEIELTINGETITL